MSYIYHGTTDLITLPQRDVQTFPSGLVRVDRTYACRKALADRFRQTLAVGNPLPLDPGTPAIDGLYIFPEPRETVRDDGFVEFRVSAYGRKNTIGNIRPDFVTGSESGINYTVSSITKELCLPTDTALSQISLAPNFTSEIVYSYSEQEGSRLIELSKNVGYVQFGVLIRFSGLPFGGFIIETVLSTNASLYIYSIFKINLETQISGSSSKGFGYFSEFTITYAAPNPVTKLFEGVSGRNGIFIDGIPLSNL